MFAFRVSLKNVKRLAVTAAVLACAAAVIGTIAVMRSIDTPRDTAETKQTGSYSLIVGDNGFDSFFAQLHIKANIDGMTEQTVVIPEEFNDVYTAYNAVQQRAGLDLSAYKGQQARQITAPVQSDRADIAVLLIIKGRVIGGHLTSRAYGSEVLPLTALYGTTG